VTVINKKYLKNVGPIHHCQPPPHAHSPDVASGTVARRLHIDVHDDNDSAWRDRYGPMEWAQLSITAFTCWLKTSKLLCCWCELLAYFCSNSGMDS